MGESIVMQIFLLFWTKFRGGSKSLIGKTVSGGGGVGGAVPFPDRRKPAYPKNRADKTIHL